MSSTNTAIASILLDTTPDRVWQALTDPAQIREYLFGTTASSEWKKGSTITYSGEWEGKKYEDKGKIIEIKPKELLHTTYFSSMSGLEDKPENYNNVFYKITPAGTQVILTVVQDNCRDEKSREHSETNWQYVLQSLKKLVEGNQ
jgi:uncharacterized protein YndB with AHSA1/START domain